MGKLEDAGRKIDDAFIKVADKTREGVSIASEKTKEGISKASEKTREAVEKADRAIQDKAGRQK